MDNHDSTPETAATSRRDVLKGALAASAGSVGLAGCIGGGGSGGGSGTLKIAYLVPTSGPYGPVGNEYQDAMRMAREDVDDEVAGNDVEVIVRDSGTSPDVAVPTAQELIREEEPDVMIGALSSAVVLALEEIAAREEIPYFGIGGTNFKATGENCNQYSFVKLASGYQYGGAPLTMVDQGTSESFYFIVADYAGGTGPYQGITDQLEANTDAELLGRSMAPLGNDDYSTQLQAARDSGADTVWSVVAVADAVTLMNQADSAGLTEDTNFGIGISTILEAESLGTDTVAGTYSGASFYHTVEESQEFTENFRNQFGRPPSNWAADAYDCCREALDAVERSGSTDADDLVSALEGNEFDWTRSTQSWRACDHRAVQPYYALEGKQESDKADSFDYYNVLGNKSGEDIMRPCDETNCSL